MASRQPLLQLDECSGGAGGGTCLGWRRVQTWSLLRRRFLPLLACFLAAAALFYAGLATQSGEGPTVLREQATPSRYSLDEMRTFAFRNSLTADFKPSYYARWANSFSSISADPKNRFNMTGKDVIVFEHIQKTAGTSFEKFLVRRLDVPLPCACTRMKKRCTCRRQGTTNEIWLFSRYSTGWVCGLHADYTELFVSGCVDTVLDKKEGHHSRRRYFYTSFLRDPITRFISEFRHVSRGATWIASRHVCNGQPPTPEELPLCFDPRIGWDGVTLDEFLACPYNLAFNRQTRMLADLTLVNCYAKDKMDSVVRNRILLESAKANLRNLAFYGLKERMADSQWMFERLFGLRFSGDLSSWSKSKSNDTVISPEMMQAIREANSLDLQLYEYAVELFNERMKSMREDERDAQQDLFSAPQKKDLTFVEKEAYQEEGGYNDNEAENEDSASDDEDKYS